MHQIFSIKLNWKFSSNIFNEDDLTIDGMSKEKLKQLFGNQLLVINEEFDEWMFFG